MRKLLSIYGNFVVLIFLVTNNAMADWYKSTKYSCSDPYDTRRFISATSWFNKTLPLKYESPHQGYVYADISPSILTEGSVVFDAYKTIELVKFDTKKSNQLKKRIEKSSSDLNVPLFLQTLPNFSGYFVSNTSAIAISSMFTYLFDNIGTLQLQRAQLIPLIASGGVLEHQTRVVLEENKYFYSSRYVYDISVGDESRKILLSACTYPANISITGFVTRTSVNNKRIIFENGKWFMETIADGKRHDGYLLKTKEDKNFIYFKAKNGFSSFYSDYRISKFGGPFQAMDEGSWMSFYTKTSPI